MESMISFTLQPLYSWRHWYALNRRLCSRTASPDTLQMRKTSDPCQPVCKPSLCTDYSTSHFIYLHTCQVSIGGVQVDVIVFARVIVAFFPHAILISTILVQYQAIRSCFEILVPRRFGKVFFRCLNCTKIVAVELQLFFSVAPGVDECSTLSSSHFISE